MGVRCTAQFNERYHQGIEQSQKEIEGNKWQKTETEKENINKTVAGKDIRNLLLAHRHNSIFNGIENAFSFKDCLCIFISLITLLHNVP